MREPPPMTPPTGYTIELLHDPPGAALRGVLRLVSPRAYEEAFAPIKQHMQAVEGPFLLDISGLSFLNSSGITGLARLVMVARNGSRSLIFQISLSYDWQALTVTSLTKLYAGVDLRVV